MKVSAVADGRNPKTRDSNRYSWSEFNYSRSATNQTHNDLCVSFPFFGSYSRFLGDALDKARRSISLSHMTIKGEFARRREGARQCLQAGRTLQLLSRLSQTDTSGTTRS